MISFIDQMEYQNGRRKLSIRCRASSIKKERMEMKFEVEQSKNLIQGVNMRRPLTGRKKMSKKSILCNSSRISQQFEQFIGQNVKEAEIEEVYYSKKLKLSDNSFILEEDAFKLQNFITGGYCCDEQFMSISKFNKSKDNFILLHEIYQKGKTHPELKKLQKEPLRSRNIFSVIYLNQNLKKMGRKETNKIFQQLKIVK